MYFLNCAKGFYVSPGYYNPDVRMGQPFPDLKACEIMATREQLGYWTALEVVTRQRPAVEVDVQALRRQGFRRKAA